MWVKGGGGRGREARLEGWREGGREGERERERESVCVKISERGSGMRTDTQTRHLPRISVPCVHTHIQIHPYMSLYTYPNMSSPDTAPPLSRSTSSSVKKWLNTPLWWRDHPGQTPPTPVISHFRPPSATYLELLRDRLDISEQHKTLGLAMFVRHGLRPPAAQSRPVPRLRLICPWH